eukprot:472056-Prymnesium_polylepis.1
MTTYIQRATACADRHGTRAAISRDFSLGTRRLELRNAKPIRRGAAGAGVAIVSGGAAGGAEDREVASRAS